MNILPTKENLFMRKCCSSPFCAVCGSSVESIKHVLFNCSFVSKVCRPNNFSHLLDPRPNNFSHLLHPRPSSALFWSNSLVAVEGPHVRDVLISLACGIWKARNSWYFNTEKSNSLVVCS